MQRAYHCAVYENFRSDEMIEHDAVFMRVCQDDRHNDLCNGWILPSLFRVPKLY